MKPKDLYSIGDIAKIMGISVQTVRLYCNMGIIVPEQIDSNNGYRYFSAKQFHYIDRTRYLLNCGFSLKEIKSIFQSNDISQLIGALNRKKAEKMEEIRNATNILETLDWYRDYFIESSAKAEDPTYCVKHIGARTLVAIECGADYEFSSFYKQFNDIRNQPDLKNLQYKRQFVSVLDYWALLDRHISYKYSGQFVLNGRGIRSKHILEIPAGDYFCFKAPILDDSWDIQILKMIARDKPSPKIVLALELEDNLKEYQHCLYEVQILF